jgi:hypothetical protein
MLLAWTLLLGGNAVAVSACPHKNDTAAAVHQSGHDPAQHGHAAHDHARGAGAPASGHTGCDSGCTCAAACNHACQGAPIPPQPLAANPPAGGAAPFPARTGLPQRTTHPPLRPPTASL